MKIVHRIRETLCRLLRCECFDRRGSELVDILTARVEALEAERKKLLFIIGTYELRGWDRDDD